MGNGINWKGQVFPAMANFTAHNRMTGVGNALKRHYMLYLLDYEQVPCPLPWPSPRQWQCCCMVLLQTRHNKLEARSHCAWLLGAFATRRYTIV
jgi:hypothetical protein